MSNEIKEIPAPIGDYIIKNADGVILQGGAYYHYSDVCRLLKQIRIDIIKQCAERARVIVEDTGLKPYTSDFIYLPNMDNPHAKVRVDKQSIFSLIDEL